MVNRASIRSTASMAIGALLSRARSKADVARTYGVNGTTVGRLLPPFAVGATAERACDEDQ